MIVANEGAVSRFREKSGVHERAEHRFACCFVEPPQAPRLLRRQPQPWHFQELSADTPDDLLNSPVVV